MKGILLSSFFCLFAISCFSQEYLYPEHFDASSSTSYISNRPYEDYDFAIPVNANVLTVPGDRVNDGSKGDYFYSVYGPRPLSDYDFHLGEDITARVKDGATEYDDDNPPPIISMCDGTILFIDDEFSDKGSIEVRCDDLLFDPDDPDSWGEIYIAYRHMGFHASGLEVGSTVQKGDVLGTMGDTGASSHHLHLSLMRCLEDCETSDPDLTNIHSLRLFDPADMPHLISTFTKDGVFVQLLETTTTTATFRAIFLPFEVSLHSFEVNYNGSNHASFVFEDINQTGDRDNPCVMPNICVFPNAFNRYKSAFERYGDWSDDYYYDHDNDGGTPEIGFPSLTYPIVDDYPFNIPTYVLDLQVSNLPSGFDPALLELEIRNIYGAGVRANAADKYIVSKASGDWDETSTWEGGVVPSTGDKVLINHDVNVLSNTSAKTITVSSTAAANASLDVVGGAKLTIDENLYVFGDNSNYDATVSILGNLSSMDVGESIIIKRYNDANLVHLKMDYSTSLTVDGDVKFISDDYTRFSGGGADSEPFLIGTVNASPSVTIKGDWVMNYGPEADKDILAKIGKDIASSASYNSPTVTVEGDLRLVSHVAESGGNDLGIQLFSNASLDVLGDIIMEYSASFLEDGHQVLLELNDNATVSTTKLKLSSILDTSTDNNLVVVSDDASFTLNGDLDASIDNAATENYFDLNDNGTLELKGAITNSSNSEFDYESTSRAIFSGAVAQTIPGTGTGSYGILEVDNTSGSALTLEGSVGISSELILKNGKVLTGANSINLTEDSTIDIQNQDSYVDGTLTKQFGSSPSEFTFQIGNYDVISPVKIVSPVSSSTVSAKYIHNGLTSTYGSAIEEVAAGYWIVDASESMDMSFGWTDACQLNIENLSNSPQTLYMVHENSDTWEQIGSATIDGSSEACDDEDSDDESGFLTMNVSSGTNNFTFGSTDVGANPLPVELISFKLENYQAYVSIKWETIVEINSEAFLVQKSKNGRDFETIKSVKAAGNSNGLLKYEVRDSAPFTGLSYYRLIQIDVNGEAEVFGPKSIQLMSKGQISIYPSAITEGDPLNLHMDISCSDVNVVIHSLDGSVVCSELISNESAAIVNEELYLNTLQKGMYILRAVCDDHSYSQKFIVE